MGLFEWGRIGIRTPILTASSRIWGRIFACAAKMPLHCFYGAISSLVFCAISRKIRSNEFSYVVFNFELRWVQKFYISVPLPSIFTGILYRFFHWSKVEIKHNLWPLGCPYLDGTAQKLTMKSYHKSGANAFKRACICFRQNNQL